MKIRRGVVSTPNPGAPNNATSNDTETDGWMGEETSPLRHSGAHHRRGVVSTPNPGAPNPGTPNPGAPKRKRR